MIAAREFTPEQVRRAYNRRSWIYSKTIAKMERGHHQAAIEMAHIRHGEKILEVAVGPGLTLVELARRAGSRQSIHGVDLSPAMLAMTRKRLEAAGFSDHDLREADSRSLPFADGQFDLVYNAFMLDLIPERDMAGILAEFLRVLRPGGRLVLLNMSKPDEQPTRREALYRRLPAALVLYLMGGCRPVLMEKPVQAAGFEHVQRTFLPGKLAAEIIHAVKPGSAQPQTSPPGG